MLFASNYIWGQKGQIGRDRRNIYVACMERNSQKRLAGRDHVKHVGVDGVLI